MNKSYIKIVLICVFALVAQMAVLQSALAFCDSSSDCGVNGFFGEQFCQGNSLYQYYVTNTCNSPGSSYSSCVASKSPQLVQTCSQKCESGLWYIGCSTADSANTSTNTNVYTGGYCHPRSYQKCDGNSVYWFDFCNNRRELTQTCDPSQICQNSACTINYNYLYLAHSTKGCFNNNVYWYDSLGNQQDLYQNCGAAGQTCDDGQCLPSSNTGQTRKISGADQVSNQAPTPTPNQTESSLTAAVSANPSIWDFMKRWYVWLIIILILIFLFAAIFRKLSSDV